MFKNRPIFYPIILVLCIFLTSCAGLQRKFTRNKKEEAKSAPIVTTYDYAKELRVDELYKKHFLFWKTWQSELIDRMDDSCKKRIECYDEALENLKEMKKYLNDIKAQELEPFLSGITSIDLAIKKDRLTNSEKYKMQQLLEKTKRQIEKRFSYSDVKGSLELRK